MKRFSAFAAVLFLCFSVFSSGIRDVVTIAMDPADKLNLNPYTASDSDSVVILQNLYEGLFEYDARTSEPVNAIAESYTVSEDGLVWTFDLDHSARFSDGSRITAQSFINSWNLLRKGPLAGNLGFLDYVQSNGDYQLEMHLKYPVSYLPGILCQPSMAAIIPSRSDVYSGPYTIKKNAEDKISLEPNRHYRSKVLNDGVEIILTENCTQQFKNGTVQWSTAFVDNAPEYIINSPTYSTTFFYFTASDGAYADVSVRKALVNVIPWNVVKAIQQGLFVTDSLVPESGAGYSDVTDYKVFLEKAGYQGGNGLGKISVAVHRGSQVSMIAELIAKLWSRYLGIEVSIDTVPVTVYTSDPSSNPYDFCIVTWIGDYLDPMAFLSIFDSTSSYNLAGYCNPEYDALLESARNADDLLRSELLKQAEQILLDECIVIPLSNSISTNFVRTDILSGWYDNPLDIHPFKNLTK